MNTRMRSTVALVLLFAGMAVGVLWWQSSRSQAQLREQVLLQAEQRSLHLADAMAGQVQGLFGSADLAVQELRLRWLRDDPKGFDAQAQRVLAALPPGFASHVTVADAQGRVVYTSLGPDTGAYMGDRAYFKAMQAAGDVLVVGDPVRSRMTGQWLFSVGRALMRDGRFAGTLHVAVSSAFLSGKLAALELSGQDVVALIHVDGRFLARSHDNAGAMKQSVPPDRPFMLEPALGAGVLRSPGVVDGIPRIYGWHRLPQSGAVVAIGLADASVLGPLAPALHRSQVITSALSLLILASGCLIAVLLWRVAGSQAAADASAARLKEAQHLAHVGDWVYDIAHDRLTWSDEVFRILGMDPVRDTPTRHLFRSRVHPDDLERLRAGYQGSLQAREFYSAEYRIVLPDGSFRHVRELCVHEYEGDQPTRSLGTVQDVTETRTAQLALQQLNEQLEQRVKARTQDLMGLNRELESFTYSVSHDLRTPLRSIHGFASLLQESEAEHLTDEGRGFLRRILESSRRMGLLITDLLSMAQHSRALINHAKVDLSALAQGVVSDLEHQAPGRRVRWQIEPGMAAQADPTLMRVVLQNLLGNAWKYTGQAAEAVISFTRGPTREDGQSTFCVRDNGAGFDMAYRDQLFQPFKRLHAHHEFEGTGIGLATVARVIQRHGGTVCAEGAVGQGATFSFSLPLHPTHAALGAP